MNEKRVNLLELKPIRNVEWESGPDGRAVLIIPKFRNSLMKKLILPWLSKSDFRIKLDTYGTFIWKHCDGRTSVSEMAEEMIAEFGSEIEPIYERIAAFIRRLEREAFLINSYPEHFRIHRNEELESQLKGESDVECNKRIKA